MGDQHQMGRIGSALQVRGGPLRAGALVALPGQQAPIAQYQHPLGVDERQRTRFLGKGIRAQGVRLQILIVELEGDTAPQRLQEVAGGPVDQVTLAAVDERDHAAGVGANTRSIFAAI